MHFFFLRYAKDGGLIEYDDKFIDRITVYSTKEENQMWMKERLQDIAHLSPAKRLKANMII